MDKLINRGNINKLQKWGKYNRQKGVDTLKIGRQIR